MATARANLAVHHVRGALITRNRVDVGRAPPCEQFVVFSLKNDARTETTDLCPTVFLHHKPDPKHGLTRKVHVRCLRSLATREEYGAMRSANQPAKSGRLFCRGCGLGNM